MIKLPQTISDWYYSVNCNLISRNRERSCNLNTHPCRDRSPPQLWIPKGIRFNKAFIVMIPLQHFLDYELYKKHSTVFYKHVFLCTTAMKIKLKNFSANYKIRQNSKLQFKIFKTIIIQSLNKASKSCDLQNNFFEENRRWRVKYVLTQIRMFCSCLSFYLSPISIVPAKIQRKTAFQSNQFG